MLIALMACTGMLHANEIPKTVQERKAIARKILSEILDSEHDSSGKVHYGGFGPHRQRYERTFTAYTYTEIVKIFKYLPASQNKVKLKALNILQKNGYDKAENEARINKAPGRVEQIRKEPQLKNQIVEPESVNAEVESQPHEFRDEETQERLLQEQQQLRAQLEEQKRLNVLAEDKLQKIRDEEAQKRLLLEHQQLKNQLEEQKRLNAIAEYKLESLNKEEGSKSEEKIIDPRILKFAGAIIGLVLLVFVLKRIMFG